MTETVDRPTVHQLAAALAAALPGWRYHAPNDPDDTRHYARLVHDAGDYAGAEFSINCDRYSKPPRVQINATFPRDSRNQYYGAGHGETHPSITVSADRPVAAIAREITRRFLPVYLPMYTKKAAQLAQAERAYADAAGLARAIAAAIGQTLSDDRMRDGGASFYLNPNRAGYASITLSSTGSFRLEFSTSDAAQALRVASLMADELRPEPDEPEA